MELYKLTAGRKDNPLAEFQIFSEGNALAEHFWRGVEQRLFDQWKAIRLVLIRIPIQCRIPPSNVAVAAGLLRTVSGRATILELGDFSLPFGVKHE